MIQVNKVLTSAFAYFLSRRDDCPERYCHDPGVGVSIAPQGKYFNLGYIV
jgi:hypothetical protein